MEYGEGTASYVIKDQYYNMKEKLEDAMFLIEDAKCSNIIFYNVRAYVL